MQQARSRAKLRQQDLADRAGVGQSLISSYESGHREPTVPTLKRLLAAAGFTLSMGLEESSAASRAFQGPIGAKVLASRQQLRRTLRDHGIRDAMVFGSVSRGEDGPDSDIDLLVRLPDNMGLIALATLAQQLEDIAGAPVDLVPEGGLKDHLRQAVSRDLVPL